MKSNYSALVDFYLEYSEGAFVDSSEPPTTSGSNGLGQHQIDALKELANMKAKLQQSYIYRTDWRNRCYHSGIKPNTFKKIPSSLEKRGLIQIDDTKVYLTEQGEKLVALQTE